MKIKICSWNMTKLLFSSSMTVSSHIPIHVLTKYMAVYKMKLEQQASLDIQKTVIIGVSE